MAYVDWKLKLKRLAACNCDYGCPCEFNGKPSHGVCEGVEAAEIVEGHFGDVDLSGLRYAAIYRWPGPVHEGGGLVVGLIDKRADDAQVDALFKILGGEGKEPTTIFNIYGSTIETELDPIFCDIEFTWEPDRRRGTMAAAGHFKASIEPIRNPVTGADHHAQIRLPNGFEFRDAEMASATIESEVATLEQSHDGVYAFMTHVTYGPHGIVEDESWPATKD